MNLLVCLDKQGGRGFHGNQHTAAEVDGHSVLANSYRHYQLHNKTITSLLRNQAIFLVAHFVCMHWLVFVDPCTSPVPAEGAGQRGRGQQQQGYSSPQSLPRVSCRSLRWEWAWPGGLVGWGQLGWPSAVPHCHLYNNTHTAKL